MYACLTQYFEKKRRRICHMFVKGLSGVDDKERQFKAVDSAHRNQFTVYNRLLAE